jgi:hypothetical protein
MTDQEILKRDIDSLRESIRLAWQDMASKPMSPTERRQLREGISQLVDELKGLLVRLDGVSTKPA